MKYFLRSYALTFLRACVFTFLFAAMNAQTPQNSIFDAFEKQPKTGMGGVVVHQSDNIKRLVGTRNSGENVEVTNRKYLKTRGYRIQVYSGNNQRASSGSNQPTSKDETMALKAKISELYPGVETYPSFVAPWWKLYVGDFLTYEEALVMKRELQKTFAQRKSEIYIVEDEIRLPLD